MGAQPATRQSDLTAATASTDTVAPSTSITSPAADTRVPPGTSLISGTAADAGGGRVGAVEVSVDGGTTWHPATGRDTWHYMWSPAASGPVTLLSRAADDSANLGSETAVTVGVGNRGCPCSLFGNAELGATIHDTADVEVGVRFRADDEGFITALRYYRAAGATGSRVGHLWADSGNLLATVTFGGESQLGWHEAALSARVHVTSGASYVASYFVPRDSGYSADPGFFDTPLDAAPLHAPAGTNGVFSYPSGFPNSAFQATNYGADVEFVRIDQTAPKITTFAPGDGAGAVDPGTTLTAGFDEAIDASTVAGATFQLRDGAGALVPADVTYDAATRTAILRPKAPLAGFVTYRATVKGGAAGIGDAAGNALVGDRTWSFTTGLSLTGPTGGEVRSSGSGSGAPGSGAGRSASRARVGPRVAPTPRTVRMSKAGTVRLRIACPLKARSCRVQLRLRLGRRDIAAKTLSVAGGKTKSVTLKLSSAARRDLRRKRSLQVTAIVTARDKAGHPATTRTSIRLLAPGRR
jgi:hypothetical protein